MEKIKNYEELSAKCSVCADRFGKKIEGGKIQKELDTCGKSETDHPFEQFPVKETSGGIEVLSC